MTGARPHQTLSILLFALAAIFALGALLLFGASDWLLAVLPGSTPPPSNPLEFFIIKAMAIFLLPFAYLLYTAARDPVRYSAVVDALIFILLIAAALNIYGIMTGLGAYYPTGYLVVRTIVQLIFAGVIFSLRPKPGGSLPGH
jgi:hypothetical protein